MESGLSDSVQVLVVGAGPVGLFGALCAARRGLEVRVLDQAWRGFAPGHATLLHGRSLELVEECGIAERVRAAGRRVETLTLHVAGDTLELELPSPALAVPQRVLEEAILLALRESGVELHAPRQAVAIEQHEDGADVRVMRRELVTRGSPANYSEWEPVESSLVRADLVIGADGYESRVRTALGIDVVHMGNLETFAMFQAPSDGPDDGASTAHLSFDDGLSSVMLPLPGGRLRFGFQVHDQLDVEPGIDRLRALLSERLPWCPHLPASVEWGTVIHFERRLARCFGKNRAWLAGDAAHVTSPLGSQSMNAGLIEAHDLVDRYASALHTSKRHDALEGYGAERAREWHKLLGVNVRFDLLPHAPRWLPAHARRLVPALPASGADLTALLERIGLRLS